MSGETQKELRDYLHSVRRLPQRTQDFNRLKKEAEQRKAQKDARDERKARGRVKRMVVLERLESLGRLNDHTRDELVNLRRKLGKHENSAAVSGTTDG